MNTKVVPVASLLSEVMREHANPSDSNYNHCDEDLCEWCEQAKNYLAAAPAQPSEGVDEGLQFTLATAKNLVDAFGGEDADVTVRWLRKAEPAGLYLHFTDYPEEGVIGLAPSQQPLARPAAELPPYPKTYYWWPEGMSELVANHMSAYVSKASYDALRALIEGRGKS